MWMIADPGRMAVSVTATAVDASEHAPSRKVEGTDGGLHSSTTGCDVAIVGAGPYGLAAAAHLARVPGVDTRVFGKPMSFWESMPKGMILRSDLEASYIGFSNGDLTVPRYASIAGRKITGRHVDLETFIGYGHWFQRNAVPDVDPRRVSVIDSEPGGFRLTLADGETLHTGRVIVAAGIESFAWIPPEFRDLPSELVSHTSQHRDLSRFADKHVIVVGGGQSALESAALLHEAGAEVEVIARESSIVWLRGGIIQRKLGRAKPLLYAQTDVGPAGLSRLVAVPRLFRRLPRSAQSRIAHRAIRPAGARWLVARLESVPISTGLSVVEVRDLHGGAHVLLDDGSSREADHVLFGTGYQVDVSRYDFLSADLVSQIRRVDGYPILRKGLESSVPGLYFLGAPAAWSFGPIMRFVSGSWFAGESLAANVRKSSRASSR